MTGVVQTRLLSSAMLIAGIGCASGHVGQIRMKVWMVLNDRKCDLLMKVANEGKNGFEHFPSFGFIRNDPYSRVEAIDCQVYALHGFDDIFKDFAFHLQFPVVWCCS